MAFRIDRVSKIIERELANIILMSSKNEKLKYVSITKVVVTKDLSIATIWYTIRGDKSEIEATKKDLVDARGYFRSELAKKLDIRKNPSLVFKYDESIEYCNKIEEILRNINSKNNE